MCSMRRRVSLCMCVWKCVYLCACHVARCCLRWGYTHLPRRTCIVWRTASAPEVTTPSPRGHLSRWLLLHTHTHSGRTASANELWAIAYDLCLRSECDVRGKMARYVMIELYANGKGNAFCVIVLGYFITLSCCRFYWKTNKHTHTLIYRTSPQH